MTKESKNIKKLCEFIWKLEQEHELFDLKIQDVYIIKEITIKMVENHFF